MKNLMLIKDYKDNPQLRQSFNKLAQHTFGIDFEKWYVHGFWDERYVCYSYIDNQNVIANASINKMELLINGQRKSALQLGTIMTHPEYRKRGLSAGLIQSILQEHETNFDVLFLFANQSVLDFYPKFDFVPIQESLFSHEIVKNTIDHEECRRKLDPSNKNDLNLIIELSSRRIPNSQVFGADHTQHITLWYCLTVYNEDIYYIEAERVIVICQTKQNKLHVFDVISEHEVSFQRIIHKVAAREIDEIIFHFTPDYKDINVKRETNSLGDVMFVKTALELPKFFKYPVTSQA
jgi:predicted GNAT family N-acyltransferase